MLMLLRLIVYGSLVLAVAFAALNWDNLLDHVDGLRAGKIDIDLPFDGLSDASTEPLLRQRYGDDNWRCIDEPENRLGSRQCHVDVRTVGGLRSLVLVYFFKAGRLAHAKVDVVSWQHDRALRLLEQRYGPPSGAQRQFVQGVRLVGWRLEAGNVLFNRDQPVNPLQWNTVFWMSYREAGAVGGLFKPGT
jgi:hypothetical protein